MSDTRRKAREEALQILYSSELTGKDISEILSDPSIIRPDGSDFRDFTKDLVSNTIQNSKDAEILIEKHTRNWKLSRIAFIDKVILRLAISEFLFFPEIPQKVTINESLEIAKKFSTSKSGKFINGILDSIYKDLSAEHKIFKEGAGLNRKNVKKAKNKSAK
ncbi:transcription antitermination factor NusB [candidate division KSB1 bacterium]